jgi:tol-pal system protein YbgF
VHLTGVPGNSTGNRILFAFKIPALFLGLMLISLGTSAHAQSSSDIAERLRQIDQVLIDLQRAVYKGEVPSRPATTQSGTPDEGSARARFVDIEIRLSEMEEQLRSMTGPIETAEHRVDVIATRLDKLIVDIDFRLSAIERKLSEGSTGSSVAATDSQSVTGVVADDSQSGSTANPGVQKVVGEAAPGTQVLGTLPASDVGSSQTAAVAPPAPAKPKGVLPEGSVRERYDFAYGLLRRLKMQDAEVALKEFLVAHTADPLADNARYWLGESYFSRRDYTRAAATFFEAYSKSPAGPKARDNLYKLGKSLARMEQKDDACASFDELLEKFNQPADKAIRQRAEVDRTELGCQ